MDEYLAALPAEQRAVLEHVKSVVWATVPEAVPTMSYGLPTFKYQGKALIHFGGFKAHMSLFPTAEPAAALKDKLRDFATAKGTIQFTVEKQVPDSVIQELVLYRKQVIDTKGN